ncbi:hypothetical protein BC826DRAFT_1105826 [Russula brevipes]|nr:hypothetical protein BC826DRAFT_1105826 [Russula brevipes]
MSPYSLDSPPREPLTLTAISPLILGYYAQAVLVILPNTFTFRVSLLPLILWQAWRCAIGFDFAAQLAQLLGRQSSDRFSILNLFFASLMVIIPLRSFEWAFVKKPFKRYELPKLHQDTPIERPLSVSNVLIDALDLLSNQRGVGWSWSSNPFPRESSPPPSIASALAKVLFELTVFDASQCIIHYVCPSVNNPRGGSIFDPNRDLVHRISLAAFSAICAGVGSYAFIDSTYHVGAVVGRIVFRHPASLWPRIFNKPWMSTSIHEFWSVRWHQLLRHLFITFGARPGGMLFGKPGALIGAFAVSAFIHHVCLWGLGNGSEFVTAGGFFLLMGVGAVLEGAFKKVTGLRVRGWIGWLWTMAWTTMWGMFMIDGWARHGMFANDFFPNRLRLGKMAVDGLIALSRM